MTFEHASQCWYLTGPTASGKTAVGIELARRLDAEIVSLDSMAVYRGMDIGTAKPTPAEQAAAAHHLLDLIEPDEPYSVAQYLEAAGQCVEAIRGRGRTPLFVGGSALYLTAILRGISAGPPPDWPLRRRLEARAREQGPAPLYDELARRDPQAAARLHPNDLRRVVRALEVLETTGRPISAHQQHFDHGRPADHWRAFTLEWPREELHRRIERRVAQMFEAGLVDEVRRLQAGPPLGRTASQAVGYREVLDYLAGRCTLAEAQIRIVQRTRQFARRQHTWLRRLTECRPVPCGPDFDAAALADQVCHVGRLGG